MNNVQIFDGLKAKEVDGKVWLDAESVAIGLGISQIAKSGNVSVIWNRVNKYLGIDKTAVDTSVNAIKRGDFITEQQFYKLAFKANNETAERFQEWVTEEVLPSIRKAGMYATDKLLDNPDLLIEAVEQLKMERDKNKQLETKIENDKPAVTFSEKVVENGRNVSMAEFAQMISDSTGVVVGRNKLMEMFRKHGVLTRDGNRPYQKFIDQGLVEFKYFKSDIMTKPQITTFITGKGQKYFTNKFMYLFENYTPEQW